MSMKSFSDTIGNRTAQYLNQLHYREPFAWGDWGKQWKALVVTDAQGRLDVNHSIASYVNHSIASYVNHSIASYFNPQIMYSFWPSRSKQPLVHFIYGILSWIIIPSFLLL